MDDLQLGHVDDKFAILDRYFNEMNMLKRLDLLEKFKDFNPKLETTEVFRLRKQAVSMDMIRDTVLELAAANTPTGKIARMCGCSASRIPEVRRDHYESMSVGDKVCFSMGTIIDGHGFGKGEIMYVTSKCVVQARRHEYMVSLSYESGSTKDVEVQSEFLAKVKG